MGSDFWEIGLSDFANPVLEVFSMQSVFIFRAVLSPTSLPTALQTSLSVQVACASASFVCLVSGVVFSF